MQQNSRILIVDDERMCRAMLAGLLKRHNYSVVEAGDAADAMEKLVEEPIGLVLLDLVMPGMDGIDLLREFRQLKSATELPIIMVTADDDSGQMVKAFKLGANDYVTKPIDVGITLARIDTQMRLTLAQRALRDSEERYALAARGANDGLWDWDFVTDEVYYSPRWKEMLGLEDNRDMGALDDWFNRIHVEDRARAESELKAHIAGNTSHFEAELRMRHHNSSYRWMLCRGLAVRNERGHTLRMAGSLTDITEGKVADGLTALPNRVLFLDRVQRCVEQYKRDADRRFAVLYLDLNDFKLVNDSLGHEAGDQLLICIARRLEESVRSCESVVARMGGDEFTILIEHLKGLDEAEAVARRVISSISEPISLGGAGEVFTSASVGISGPLGGCKSAEDILREADTAMYAAKSQGNSLCRVFDPSMQQQLLTRLQVESELRRGVERGEFELHYQSIVELETLRVVGFEALIRWQHPQRGLVFPSDFIQIAEDTKLIVPMDRWVLRQACQQMAAWNSRAVASVPLSISVNVSSAEFSEGDLFAEVVNAVTETGLAPTALRLEVTETAIMENPEDGARILAALRSRGVRIGIDDFGTGYSSLAALHRLPLDVLKVDRSFVNKLAQSQENRAIVRTIVKLAESLNLDVVAEGIETSEQCEQLVSMGCRYGQGFYFSRPLTAAQVESVLLNQREAV